ncbi:MAG TPA: glycosyltransferase family 2 protein [Verrucomicrobiae bacterium]|nr:glycosyltransferase family 2 protein [Verrucomicrobiae bacterium]
MDWQAACAAVIPCLNEAAAIGPLVQAIGRHVPTIFVVNDGSVDGTASVAKGAGAIVLNHETTLGKGRALKTGWAHAHHQGYRWALALDGDGQHSPEDIPSFFHCAEIRSASLVVGNRMDEASRIPLVRRWVNRWMSWQISALSGRDLPDSQCGFRLMNLMDWAHLHIQASHFEIESEVLFSFARAGLGIEFVPIHVIYKQERSKIHPWRDTRRWLRWRRNARRNLKTFKSGPAN